MDGLQQSVCPILGGVMSDSGWAGGGNGSVSVTQSMWT